MRTNDRLGQIIQIIDEKGFASVRELSQLCDVTEMTIRRDLETLHQRKQVRRTFGGAISLHGPVIVADEDAPQETYTDVKGLLAHRADVLVVALNTNRLDGLLPDSVRKTTPIIAESLPVEGTETCVSLDNYQAGHSLGKWAAQYARENKKGQAHLLDLTYHTSNTLSRSRGFVDGLREMLDSPEIVLSINAQSRYSTAYQLTRDALVVHPSINMIFAINDSTALAAINACRDLNISPNQVTVVPFGLEGDTMKNALMENTYVKGGLLMFPEIVGPACVEAAIEAYNRKALPGHVVTPYAVVTKENLNEFYKPIQGGWQMLPEVYTQRLYVPLNINPNQSRGSSILPDQIGFVIPFREHDWYQKMIHAMQTYAANLNIGFGVVNAEQSIKEELEQCRQEIALAAVDQIEEGDVVIVDGGPSGVYMASLLLNRKGITVITNSSQIFHTLCSNPDINLISTGGILRFASQLLVGPMAETMLREIRADKLFLNVTGVTLNFGLSHTNISEVTIKQTMMHSAREVILLADHNCFGQESVIQVAPCTAVQKIITDDALSASFRLDLSKLGIEVILAKSTD